MKTIKYLWLEITPTYYSAGGDELRIKMRVNGKEVGYSQVLLDDDMTSRFDYIFTAAREAIRHEIETDDA